MKAEALIRIHLSGCLPPGAPLSFRRIVTAEFVGTGRKRKAVGCLEMFDGQPATVEVFRAGKIQGHRWTDMPGGACSLEAGGWVRCDEHGNILPAQADLFAPPPSSPDQHERPKV